MAVLPLEYPYVSGLERILERVTMPRSLKNSASDSPLTLPRIWFGVFVYTSLIAVLVQFFILTVLFPSWNDGNGLIKGMDACYFNKVAVELSTDIRAHGWSQWKLRPGEFGQSAYLAEELYKKYGLTASDLVSSAEALVKKS